MDKKSKILLSIFFLFLLASVGVTFYRVMILKRYYVKLEIECNPEKEKCFVRECDPQSDSECPENVDERASYYKIINKKAYILPNCDPNDENCPKPSCEGDKKCQETLCDEKTVPEGETCNDPEEYLKNNSEEENAEGINDEDEQEGSEGENQFQDNLKVDN